MEVIFNKPKAMGISGRTSSITNSFVNAIIPTKDPTSRDIKKSLEILQLNKDDLRCAYCGDRSTEWDHLRSIVANKHPTGYISEIHNLVPSCGKCNQSKGGKYWKDWINSEAKLSPKTRGIPDLDIKIRRLEAYEKWGNVKPCDFKEIVGEKLWEQYWQSCSDLHVQMKKAQKLADKIKKAIKKRIDFKSIDKPIRSGKFKA